MWIFYIFKILKKLRLYLYCLIFVVAILPADMVMYAGEQGGKNIVGIAGQIKVGNVYYYCDTRTNLDSFEGTYFSPGNVGFYSEVGLNLRRFNLAASHTCKHSIDKPLEGTPEENREDKIFIRFNW